MRWLPLASYLLRQVVVAGYAVLASCVAGYMAVARKIAGHVELQLILPTFSDRAPRPCKDQDQCNGPFPSKKMYHAAASCRPPF